jgi:thiamine biosynthesis lipoprotein
MLVTTQRAAHPCCPSVQGRQRERQRTRTAPSGCRDGRAHGRSGRRSNDDRSARPERNGERSREGHHHDRYDQHAGGRGFCYSERIRLVVCLHVCLVVCLHVDGHRYRDRYSERGSHDDRPECQHQHRSCYLRRVLKVMPLLESLPLTPATAQWPVWSTTARLVVTDPALLPAARDIAEQLLADVDAACSRFRLDSELAQLAPGQPVYVSALLAQLVRTALAAADATDGLVTPTIGGAVIDSGYDRDWALMGSSVALGGTTLRVRQAPSWRGIALHERCLTVPSGIRLDLGATGKAFTSDLIATAVAQRLGVGVLVGLGGDIATAGPTPDGGWNVLVQDRPGDPSVTVALPPNGAIATSSTQGRRWLAGGQQMHHILDPRSCRPAETIWRTATVAAATCAQANSLSTAALILGREAPDWLRAEGSAARLVSAAGDVLCLNGFPL